MTRRNIALFGFMGTGKTSVGKMLAADLDLQFTDMDLVIEASSGKSISRIFAENGEPYFRSLEKKLVKELAMKSGLVIGTGGGVVLDEENINDLSRTGMAVCLMAEPEEILKRLEHDGSRPLLADGDKLQKIKSILDKRKHLYERVPVRIQTTGMTVKEVSERIKSLYAS